MARILAVGVATLDIVQSVEHYPHEDDEVRAQAQHIWRGGNAANLAVVLSQLGHSCAWAGVLTDDLGGQLIRDDLSRQGVDIRHAHTLPGRTSPTSCILASRSSGSRTIVHYRDLPEYDYTHFGSIDLQDFDWVHFEGRNVEETARMLQRCRSVAPRLRHSVEVEKPRPGIEQLFAAPDLLMFSKAYAHHAGYQDGAAFIDAMHVLAPQADVVCAWGAHGAYGLAGTGAALHCDAVVPDRVLDTRGAGDVFNAGFIAATLRGESLAARLAAATALAGHKCGRWGFDNLATTVAG